jgi:uncharacterized protein
VYCIEQADYKEMNIFDIVLLKKPKIKARYLLKLLKGVVILEGKALLRNSGMNLNEPGKIKVNKKTVKLTAIPYFSWSNRSKGAMRVWIPE